MENPIQQNDPKLQNKPIINNIQKVKRCRVFAIINAFFFPKYTGIDFKLFFESNSSSCNEQIISNPDTQNKTTKEKSTGIISKTPLTAKYAPIGANERLNPKKI